MSLYSVSRRTKLYGDSGEHMPGAAAHTFAPGIMILVVTSKFMIKRLAKRLYQTVSDVKVSGVFIVPECLHAQRMKQPLSEEKRMVRDTGFEPVTPTVSR